MMAKGTTNISLEPSDTMAMIKMKRHRDVRYRGEGVLGVVVQKEASGWPQFILLPRIHTHMESPLLYS